MKPFKNTFKPLTNEQIEEVRLRPRRWSWNFLCLVEQASRANALAAALEAMKANLICDQLADGTIVHDWFTVAPCEFGEAVDAALAAYRGAEQPKEPV